MMGLLIHPIGTVHSPYTNPEDVPIQGVFGEEVEAWVELERGYARGLSGLEEFSHAILIYHFHRSHKERIEAEPFLEHTRHGVFAIRSPHRPNNLGLSVVRIRRIKGNRLYFTDVDVLDTTPVLDIKPYVRYFDCHEDAVCGWIDKHFADGVPEGARGSSAHLARQSA